MPDDLDDPRLVLIRRALAGRPAARVARAPDTREAAVALLLRPRDSLELLFIKRAELLGDPWSGHMALPGGRRDAADLDLAATALRETLEETGIDVPRADRLLGALDEVEPGTRRLPPIMIAPFVAAVSPETQARPNPREVDAAIWIPLDALRDPTAVREILIELGEGQSRRLPAVEFEGYTIWGLTHRVLTQFLALAETLGL